MINPKDLDFNNPDTIKNIPKEFLEEMKDGRDSKEIKNDKKGDNK